MTAPSPAAAAQAWLARLPEAERAAAHAYTDARLLAWVVGGLLLIAVCVIVGRSGLLARLRRAIEASRPRPWAASAALAGVLAFAIAAFRAPFGAWAAWRGEEILSHGGGAAPGAGLAAHLAQAAAGVAPSVAAAMVLAPPLLWLMRRRPRTWPLVLGASATVLLLAVGWLPYALALEPPLTPAPPGPVRDGLVRLIAEIGLPTHEVYATADPTFDADVAGAFGLVKVVVGPALMAAPPEETRAFVAHVAGHNAHADVFWTCLIHGVCILLGLIAAQRWAPALARLIGAHDVRGAGDPEALPALAILLAATLVFADFAGGAYLRWANVRADAYSLDHAREPDGLAAVIEREWDHESVDPSPIETALFYTHPPLARRLAHAMAWKAAHGG